MTTERDKNRPTNYPKRNLAETKSNLASTTGEFTLPGPISTAYLVKCVPDVSLFFQHQLHRRLCVIPRIRSFGRITEETALVDQIPQI